MRFRRFLFVAVAAGAFVLPAAAQELQFDSKSLDAGAAQPDGKKPAKSNAAKSNAAKPKPAQGQTSGKAGGDRQFGELEGWSPGKAPPKAKDKEADPFSNPSSHGGIGVTPSGNMGIGLPF